MSTLHSGEAMHAWLRRLFPLCRSLTGDGVRATLREIHEHLPELRVEEVASGTSCFDWTVPPEWNIRDAAVFDEAGERVIDFRRSNLHVVGYSEPVDKEVELDELRARLHTLPDQPEAVPYVTSYYRRTWGFCCAHSLYERLRPQRYRVWIDADLAPGQMSLGSAFFPGELEDTVLLSTYICHPSMANNELSGPVLQTAVGQWIKAAPRRLSYLLLYMPETIGPIYYLSRHLDKLRRTVKAGFVLSCCGDERGWSYLPSRRGDSLSDRVLLAVLEAQHPEFRRYSFLDRASDERQYQSPGVDLPVIPFARSLYRHYPEYHTSLDDCTLVTPRGLAQSLATLTRCLDLLEGNRVYRRTCLCEPQLGRRGLYPTTSTKGDKGAQVVNLSNFLAYCDGQSDLLDIARQIAVPASDCLPLAALLREHDLIRPDTNRL